MVSAFFPTGQTGSRIAACRHSGRSPLNIDALLQKPGYDRSALPFVITLEACRDSLERPLWKRCPRSTLPRGHACVCRFRANVPGLCCAPLCPAGQPLRLRSGQAWGLFPVSPSVANSAALLIRSGGCDRARGGAGGGTAGCRQRAGGVDLEDRDQARGFVGGIEILAIVRRGQRVCPGGGFDG